MRSVKRLRERATLFAALLGVVAIVSGLGVGLIGYLAYAETQGTRVELAARTGSDSGLEVSLTRDENASAQDELVRGLLLAEFTDGDRAIPITIDRTVEGAANVQLRLEDDAPTPSGATSAVVLSVPELRERATLVDGTWPAAVDEVSVQADAAAALGLTVGTRFELGDTAVTVTATWRAINPLDPRWLGDQRVVSGMDGRSIGPIVIDENAWAAVGMPTRARWVITPIVELMHSSDLAAIGESWDGIRNELRNGGIDTGSFDERGRLVRTALQVQERVDALRAVEPVALLIIVAVALVTVIELARLLGSLRAAELLLMWSRGATTRSLATAAAIEVAIVAGVGAALGAGVAVLTLFGLVGGADALTATGAAVWLVPLTATLAAVVIASGTTLLATRAFSRHDKPDDAGRVRRAAGPGAVVLITVAAVISAWQLLLYGSPLTPARGGGTQVDPVAVVAPALALVSIVLLVLLAIPLATPATERAARRARGVSRAFVSRTLIRRIGIAATPLVVIALATGQLVLAAGYGQTWNDSYTATSQLRAGSELRLTGTGDDLSSPPIDGQAVTAVAPVFHDTIVIGLDAASLVGVTPAALRDLATDASGLLDLASTATAITARAAGTLLPEGVTSLRVDVRTHQLDEPPVLSVLLVDEYGSTRTVPTDADYLVTLPRLAPGVPGTWRVTGFDVALAQESFVVDPDDPPIVEITGLATERGDPLDLGKNWIAVWLATVNSELKVPTTVNSEPKVPIPHPGALLQDGVTQLRLLPATAVMPPVAISQALATRNSVAVGDTLFLPLDSRADPAPFLVSAIIPAIPGAQHDAAVLVDLGLVQAVQQRWYQVLAAPRQLWVETDDHVAAIASLRAALPAGVRIQSLVIDPSRGILQSGSIALWIGAAGAGLLALAAVAAVVSAQLRSRRPEALVLRALGLGSGAIAALRRWELVAALAAGTVVGLVAGLVVTLLTVPALARAAVPNQYASLPTTPGLDLIPLAAGLAGLILLVAALVGVYGLGVSNQVRRSSRVEEGR